MRGAPQTYAIRHTARYGSYNLQEKILTLGVWALPVVVLVAADYKQVVELDPTVREARAKIPGLERACAERMEKLKTETMGASVWRSGTHVRSELRP